MSKKLGVAGSPEFIQTDLPPRHASSSSNGDGGGGGGGSSSIL